MPHIHEKVDFTVEVFVVYNNKVLLRKHDKYKIWLSTGGHIELEDDPNQAAVREVKEEVGLDIELIPPKDWKKIEDKNHNELIPPIFMNRHRINPTHEHVSLIFYAKSKTDRVIQGETEVSEECRWFSMDELNSKKFDLPEKIRYYAKKVLELVNG